MSFRSISILIGLLVTAGCDPRHAAPNSAPSAQVESEQTEPDDPEVVHSVERMLATDSTEAQKWVETHRPAWAPGVKRIYETGVKTVVIHERDEDFVGRIPYAMIIDRGDAELESVQKALWDLLTEQEIRDHGQTMTSRYTVLYLY